MDAPWRIEVRPACTETPFNYAQDEFKELTFGYWPHEKGCPVCGALCGGRESERRHERWHHTSGLDPVPRSLWAQGGRWWDERPSTSKPRSEVSV